MLPVRIIDTRGHASPDASVWWRLEASIGWPCRALQGRRRLRATDSDGDASAEATADSGQLTYMDVPPDFGVRVPSGDTDDEPDMEFGHAADLATLLSTSQMLSRLP